jgi:hypothetical protein
VLRAERESQTETDPREYRAYLGASEENSDRECRETIILIWRELKIYYVNEHRFHNRPHVKMQARGQPITAVVGSGSEATLL